MARYIGPVCRLCRREGMKLFLKGERCHTDKCGIERRNIPPGQHGKDRRPKLAGYGLQLREKQKARRVYGLQEVQFRNLFEKASKMKGITGEQLLSMLERRLDNVVYRLGFARSRNEARILVRHAHFRVNGKPVNIPSFSLSPGDVIALKDRSRKSPVFQAALETRSRRGDVPRWLELSADRWEGVFKELPAREDITMPIEEQMIVELYSK